MQFLRSLMDALFGKQEEPVPEEKVEEAVEKLPPSDDAHDEDEDLLLELQKLSTPSFQHPSTPPATRQLPSLEEGGGQVDFLSFGHATDVGKQRENNQDGLIALHIVLHSSQFVQPFGLFAVADGMGGHGGGDLASAITLETLAQELLPNVYLSMLDHSVESPQIRSNFVSAFSTASVRIKEAGIDGGTTCTAALIHGNLLHLAHVGDSRAYLIHDGEIEQISRDHSLTGRLVEIGQLSPAELRSHPDRSKLYKALGVGNDQEPELVTRHLDDDSWLVLCSDGMWEPLNEGVIMEIVYALENPQLICNRLVELANEVSGDDNITAVVVRIPA